MLNNKVKKKKYVVKKKKILSRKNILKNCFKKCVKFHSITQKTEASVEPNRAVNNKYWSESTGTRTLFASTAANIAPNLSTMLAPVPVPCSR